MLSARKDVSFRTVDGLVLRGWLYTAGSTGPAMIVTPGVSSYMRVNNTANKRQRTESYSYHV